MRLIPCTLLIALLTFSCVLYADTATQNDNPQYLGGQTLEDFFTSAVDFSPVLRIAEDRLEISKARRRNADGQLLPQVSATATVNENRRETSIMSDRYQGQRYALRMRQILFDWQLYSLRGESYALSNQAEAEYYGELARLLADVAESYFNVLEAQDTLASIDAELRAVSNQQELVQRQYDLQLVQVTDLYDVDARVALLEAELLNATGELNVAREALRSLTGRPAGTMYELSADLQLQAPEGNAEFWAGQARAANHQISAREYAVDAAGRRVSSSRGAYMPQVALIAQQQRSDLGFDNQPLDRTDTGYIGIDINIPLYAGGSNRASVREAVSQENIARNELRQVQLEVSDQARMLFLRLQTNVLRMEAADKRVQSMMIAAESRQRAFEMGNVTSVDVLDALRDLFAARRDRQSLRYEHINLELRLKQTAGTLNADDLIEISDWLRPPE